MYKIYKIRLLFIYLLKYLRVSFFKLDLFYYSLIIFITYVDLAFLIILSCYRDPIPLQYLSNYSLHSIIYIHKYNIYSFFKFLPIYIALESPNPFRAIL